MYIGGLLQKVTANGVDDYRYQIYGANQLIAIMSRSTDGANATRYVLSDHQGSVAKITNSDGSTYVSESFSAFGTRRNPQTWSGSPTYGDQSNINAVSRDGYTGQTALGNLGLNHMNGRVQDAIIGRFLSADPYITEPGNTQNYNRYSHVINNPLTLIDPSGFKEVLAPCDGNCDVYPCLRAAAGYNQCWVDDAQDHSDNSRKDDALEEVFVTTTRPVSPCGFTVFGCSTTDFLSLSAVNQVSNSMGLGTGRSTAAASQSTNSYWAWLISKSSAPGKENSCGQDGGVRFPNMAGGVDFNDACISHDVCYQKLGAKKYGCDWRLRSDIEAAFYDQCKPGFARTACIHGGAAIGTAYFIAVAIFGGDAYEVGQRSNSGYAPLRPWYTYESLIYLP